MQDSSTLRLRYDKVLVVSVLRSWDIADTVKNQVGLNRAMLHM